jgi:tetratricopeptide (TPR) repeat protein
MATFKTTSSASEMEDILETIEETCSKIDDILNDRVPLDENAEFQLTQVQQRRKEGREKKRVKEEQERTEKIRRGREGGGEKEDYENYCSKCRVEYTLKTDQCVRCDKKTLTMKERRGQLIALAEQYKAAKLRRQERKQKWEMWQKTKSMFWKKTATNYEKWDYYTDSEDEFETAEKNAPAVLPKNDPNFRALEADLEKRNASRKRRAKEANELKKKGNDQMKKQYYADAIKSYSEGIEVFRNNRYLWSNRALAYIKKGEHQSAIDDCTKMLEYAEVLENGYTESRDLNFKFFARRAMAYTGLKQYEKALSDIDNALKLYPEDASALETRKELLVKLQTNQKLEELEKKLNTEQIQANFTDSQQQTKAKIDGWIALVDGLKKTSDAQRHQEVCQSLKEFDYFTLKDLVTDKDMKLYLFRQGGTELIKRVFKQNTAYHVTSRKDKLNFLTWARIMCEDDSLYCDQFIENGLVSLIVRKIMKDLNEIFPENTETASNMQVKQDEMTEKTGTGLPETSVTDITDEKESEEARATRIKEMYDYMIIEIEELVEFLVMMSENRSIRAYLRERGHLLIPTYKIIQEKLMPLYVKENSVLSSLLSLYSNLSMNDVGIKNTEIRDFFVQQCLPSLFRFSGEVLVKTCAKPSKLIQLLNSCLAFIVNLSTDKKARDDVHAKIVTFEGLHKGNLSIVVKQDEFNYVAWFMQSLGKTFNELYSQTASGKLKDQQIQISRFYEHGTGLLINLFFQMTDKPIIAHMQAHFRRWKLDHVAVEVLHNILKFKLNMGILLNRFLNVVAKLGYEDNPANNEKMLFVVCQLANLFEDDPEKNKDFFTDAIRFLANLLMEKKELGKLAVNLTLLHSKGFNTHLRNIVSKESSSIMR